MYRSRKKRKTSLTGIRKRRKAQTRFSARAKLNNSKAAEMRLRWKLVKYLIILILFSVFIGGLSWLSFYKGFSVNSIIVYGNDDIKTNLIEKYSLQFTQKPILFIFSQNNIFLYPNRKLEKSFKADFFKIKDISIDKQIVKKRISITIEERKPYAYWCDGFDDNLTCYNIDEEGFLFELNKTLGELVVFRGGLRETKTNSLGLFVSEKYFKKIKEFITELEKMNIVVDTFEFDGDDAKVTLKSGMNLKIALNKDLGATVYNLKSILDEYDMRANMDNIKYIDLRFDERVFYKEN